VAFPSDINKFSRVAKQRLTEAQILLKNELWAAAIYLAGYAIECSLKALLISLTPAGARPTIVKSLKDDFGHNLRRLRAGVVSKKVNIPENVASALLFASSWSPDLRYEPGPGDPEEANRFIAAAKVVVEWASARI